ncbi:MAG: D-glycero-beta-D-manno-heptose 1,7-bisphosphate 7-phosphatase [Gammaproteobacteria bacterium]|nr:D-glycero-beta-D-manno-heptose 1,7-bisphosphate 7-phosphatase [Gammaproteobacteria bacterium]
MSRGLVILDRDGVINHDSDSFIKSPDEWRPIDGSIDAIARLSVAGFDVAVATNQSGVARWLLDLSALEAIHKKMEGVVRDAGGVLARIVFCPHHPDDGCHCRKPRTDLFLQLGHELGVALNGVPMVGDSERDMIAARAVGGRPMLVLTGNGKSTAATLTDHASSPETFEDLSAAASFLIAESPHRST